MPGVARYGPTTGANFAELYQLLISQIIEHINDLDQAHAAGNLGVDPAVEGATTLQDVLEALSANKATTVALAAETAARVAADAIAVTTDNVDQEKAGKFTGLAGIYVKGGGPVVDVAAHADTSGLSEDAAGLQAAIDEAGPGGTVRWGYEDTVLVAPSGVAPKRALTALPGQVWEGQTPDRGGIKLAAGVGNYDSMIAAADSSVDMSGFTVRHLRVDQNGSGNPIASSADLPAGGNQSRSALKLVRGDDVTLDGMAVADIGDSINTIILNGDSGGSSYRMRRARIIDLLCEGVGLGAHEHDHSTVYLVGDGMTMRQPIIRSRAPGLIGAVCAIETHGPNISILEPDVENFTNGMNITGVAGSESDTATVKGGHLRGVAFGIYLWSMAYAGHAGYGLRNAEIAGVSILVDREQWLTRFSGFAPSVTAGIAVNSLNDIPTRNVSIHNNPIRFLPSATPLAADDFWSAAISWYRTTAAYDEDVLINDNPIDSPLVQAIYANARFRGLEVCRNHITDPASFVAGGGMGDAQRVAIFVNAPAPIYDSKVNANEIIDRQAPGKISRGMYLLAAADNSVFNCEALDNRVRRADGTAIPPIVFSAGIGRAWSVRQRVDWAHLPANPVRYGSTYIDEVTGTTKQQITAPAGTTWADLFDINGGTP